jgi:hypothetical protein
MIPTQRVPTIQALLVAALLAVAPPEDAAAQGGQGFLFKEPVVSVGFRMGYAMPRAGSDIFAHTRDQLTIEKKDFAGGYYGGELAVRLSDRLDLALGVGYSGSSTASEFRDWVDLDDLPIEQVTEFSTTPVTLSAKYYLTDRGRSIGRFAWVPSTLNAFVGGGLGLTYYRFEQDGDWVDFETLDIFTSQFTSKGDGLQLHALAGLEVSISRNFYLTGEGRYLWADAPIDELSFEGFDDVDLAGLQFTIGISARF